MKHRKTIKGALICLVIVVIFFLWLFAINAEAVEPERDYFSDMILFAASNQLDRLEEAEQLRNRKIKANNLPYEIVTSRQLLDNFEEYAGFSLHVDYLECMKDAVLSGDDVAGLEAETARNRKIDILRMQAVKISYEDLKLLSKIITAEAGSYWLDEDWKMATGEVVLNRVASPEFPNTVREVLEQPGQYYGKGNRYFTNLKPYEICVDVAARLLNGERILNDSAVVFQANFIQGSGVHTKRVDQYLGPTYYCYSSHMELY